MPLRSRAEAPTVRVVLVSGERLDARREHVQEAFDRWGIRGPGWRVVHGAAAGVDATADELARERGCDVVPVPVDPQDWEDFGPIAGCMRNTDMLRYQPEIVLAFPGPESKGTRDMIRKAVKAGIETHVHWRREGGRGAGSYNV